MTEQIGVKVARELIGMGITLLPKRYEVWFVHRNGEDRALSARIEEMIASGGRVCNAFLDRMCTEFLDDSVGGRTYTACAGGLGESSEELHGIAAKFARSVADYDEHAADALGRLEAASDDPPKAAMIMRESVEKTKQTLQSVKGLEEELKRASAAIDALKVSLNEAQKAAITDSLTGLFNRRHFQRCLDIAMEEAEKDRRPLSVVMADIDHFKSVNDTWGHQTGDQVIQFFARLVASNTKGKDIIARYGGEEFVMLLPDTAAAEAAKVAEAIRAMLEQRVLRKRLTNELLGRITVSLGVAEADPGEDRDSLIEAADSALYEAKRLGRNRVAIAPPRRELARARA